jgi:restriction system protein
MIRFARRHPFLATMLYGPVLIVVVALFRAGISAVLVLLWIGLIIFFAVRWLRRLRKPKVQPINLGIPPRQAPYVPTYAPPAPAPVALGYPTIGDVLTLTAAQFEDLCRDLLTACGFQGMTRCGGAGDLGADVKGRDRQGRSVIVQAKRYAPGNQVGSPVLQSFIGMMTVQHRAERGVFVTSAAFSLPAINLAKAHGVTLIDGATLLTLMALTGVGCAPQSFVPPPVMVPAGAPGGTYQLTGWNHTADSFQTAINALASPNNASQANVVRRAPKFCTSCGDAAGDGVVYCANCGQKINRLSA